MSTPPAAQCGRGGRFVEDRGCKWSSDKWRPCRSGWKHGWTRSIFLMSARLKPVFDPSRGFEGEGPKKLTIEPDRAGCQAAVEETSCLGQCDGAVDCGKYWDTEGIDTRHQRHHMELLPSMFNGGHTLDVYDLMGPRYHVCLFLQRRKNRRGE